MKAEVAARRIRAHLRAVEGILAKATGTTPNGRRPPRPRNQLRHKFLKLMLGKPDAEFKTSQFYRFTKKRKSDASATLHNMMNAGQVKRVGDATYVMTSKGRRLAESL